jgi:hypothetical protein
MSSTMIHGVGRDAARIATAIAERTVGRRAEPAETAEPTVDAASSRVRHAG